MRMIIIMPGGPIRGGASPETVKLADQLLMVYLIGIVLAFVMFWVCMWDLHRIGKEKKSKPVAEEVKNDRP